MLRLFPLFLIELLFYSCSSEKEKFEYYRFGKQVTPSGKYVIYDYARFGPMAFSSDISATEVFSISETFEEGKGTRVDGAIAEWLSDDTLLVFNFRSELQQPKDTLPIKTEHYRVGDFIVKSINYKSNSGGRVISDFDSVSITQDSIWIRLVSEAKGRRIISFPLGGTYIKVKSDTINHIEVSTRLHKSMDFVYKNPDGTFTSDLPHVGTTRYDLTPVKKISPLSLQEKKVFWEK
ncbi:hypothetical protein [Rufibacter psychrotolerans]|uniref:hypothetical protein n=1 Tax=Rufibacter psychrotolerans TaxID=2812556 RepID=UPI00196748BB|nr:hypothetical protein [Rufibacter sp. SYSU D00308]